MDVSTLPKPELHESRSKGILLPNSPNIAARNHQGQIRDWKLPKSAGHGLETDKWTADMRRWSTYTRGAMKGQDNLAVAAD